MGRFDTTKATINANIKKNGNQEITGSILNSVMTEMVDATDAELAKLSAKVSGGRKDLVPEVDFQYIDGDYGGIGVIDYTASYWHSSPIFLKKGESIYTKRQYRGNTWAIVQVTKDGAWVKGLVKVDQSLEHSYTAAEDMYVSITNTKVNATSYRPLEEAYLVVSGLNVLPSELQELKDSTTKAIDELSASLGKRIDLASGVDYQQNQGSINKLGILKADDANFWYSTPIEVKRGEVVHMTTPYQGSGMAIGRTDADGNYYAPIAIHDKTKSYIANIDFDGYIAITFIKGEKPTEFYKETSQFVINKGIAETYADLALAQEECKEIDYKALEVQHETHFTNLCIQARFERGKMVAELATLTDDDILAQGSCGYTESNGQITDGTIQWRIYKGGLLHISGYGKMYDFIKGAEAAKSEEEVHQKVRDLGAEFWYYGFVNENVNGIVPPFPQSNQKYDTDEVMNYSNKRYVPFGEEINPLNGKPYGYSAPWYIYRVHVDDSYTSYDLYKEKNPNEITYNRILIEEDASKGGITYIGNWAFYRVSADTLILPASVTKIGCWGVRYSPVLKALVMGDNITTIEDHGVSRMEAMEAVKISNKLVSLGYEGMSADAQLKMVEFPDTTTSLGSFCFNGCGSLQIANFGSCRTMPRNFATLSSLVKAYIPITTETIGANAFYKTDINRLIIPSNVSNIESDAFRFVDIKVVVIESQSILDKMTIQNAPETTQLQQGACIGRCDYILIPIGLTPSYAIEQLFLYKGEDENYRYYKRNTPKIKLDS